MPPLDSEFGRLVDRAVGLAQAGEVLFNAYPTSSLVREELTLHRLEALYEMAFLRIFLSWESFLEESFLRYLCGYNTKTGITPSLTGPSAKTLSDASLTLLDGAPFISWTRPNAIVTRCQKFVTSGSHENVILSSTARLNDFADVRNRIAHRSTFARDAFEDATTRLAGRRYRGNSAGRFLRDAVPTSAPQERWLNSIGTELKNLSSQITA